MLRQNEMLLAKMRARFRARGEVVPAVSWAEATRMLGVSSAQLDLLTRATLIQSTFVLGQRMFSLREIHRFRRG